MFRFVILAFVALRVTLCPLFCAANASSAQCHESAAACCCCDLVGEHGGKCAAPFDSSDQPYDSGNPCCPGNVCQVIINVNQRLIEVADVQVADVVATVACEDANPIPTIFSLDDKEFRRPFRSGRDIRLVYASLLL